MIAGVDSVTLIWELGDTKRRALAVKNLACLRGIYCYTRFCFSFPGTVSFSDQEIWGL